jgi:acyl dehydratase
MSARSSNSWGKNWEFLTGSTIAHGYLTLSLLAAMQMEMGIVPAGVSQALNYGLDRVRFIAPV